MLSSLNGVSIERMDLRKEGNSNLVDSFGLDSCGIVNNSVLTLVIAPNSFSFAENTAPREEAKSSFSLGAFGSNTLAK